MWSSGDDASWRRLSVGVRKPGSASSSMLRVSARGKKSKKGDGWDRARPALLIGGLLLAAVVVLGGLFLGVRQLFAGNGAFCISSIDVVVDPNGMLTPELVKEYAAVEEGMNLFDVDIHEIRRMFLGSAANVKSVTVSRQLPDTLRIEIQEREPIAHFYLRRGLVTDREGTVFVMRQGYSHLPSIRGYGGNGIAVRPRARVRGMAVVALEVIDACRDEAGLALQIRTVDVDHDEYVVLYVPHDNKMWRVHLRWEGMGTATDPARKALVRKLRKIEAAMKNPGLQHKSVLDATLLDGSVRAR